MREKIEKDKDGSHKDESHPDGFKPYLKLTFVIGLGFFTMGLMDPLYDTYLPIFLGKWISSMRTIGFIMTLDNIFAIMLIPIVSVWSDRTRTPIGRRMPFILATLPLTAVFYSFIPYAAVASLMALVVVVFFLNIFKQAARGPVVALMPDIIPGDFRSEANGVINTMGGIATIVGTVALARLMDVKIVLPIIGDTRDKLPFPLAGILVVIATLLLFIFVREKPESMAAVSQEDAVKRTPFWASLKTVARAQDKSAIRILVSLFLWFLAYQGVLPWIGKYSIDKLGMSSGNAALGAGMVGIAYAIFAIPSGYLAHKIGRKKAIRIALTALTLVLLALFFFLPFTSALGLSGLPRMIAFWAILFVFGIFWVTVITNSFPMLWQMADHGTMGIYTGLYYTFSQAAAISAPPITGTLIDMAGYPAIFLFSAVCMTAACLTMAGVDKGEADPVVLKKR
ncbi:MAG: MFS transporter [Treponemataceae bacterium]